MKPAQPDTELVRRGGLVEWLGGFGIAERDVLRMVEDGVISTRRTRPNGRGYYLVREVKEKVLKPLGVG